MTHFEDCWKTLVGVAAGPGRGYNRFAWTDADEEVRAWFKEQAEQRDLHYEVDRNGNQWAWLGPPAPNSVVTGSHLDSVPDGGAFDGPLGVVSAFCALDAIRERDVPLSRSLAVVNFADEEGARFGVACAGSRLLTGALDPETARGLVDRDGVTMATAMALAGVDPSEIGPDPATLERIGVFVELHIEQGRALADLEAPIGVATAIWPHGRWRYRYRGRADHAGTTLLEDRRDPMLAFASTVLAARDLAEEAGAVTTFGRVSVAPNATNAIPAQVDAWLDARAAHEQTLTNLVRDLTAKAEAAAKPHRVDVEVAAESYSPVVQFGDDLRERIVDVLGGVPTLPTRAGHDAGILSAHVPSAMLFVRNFTGVSHSPHETAELDDCVAGVEALTTVLADLTTRPDPARS